MGDLISRQAAIDAVDATWWNARGIRKTIQELPSAQQWIPCSERLPEDYQDVLVWFEYYRYGSYNRMYSTHGIGTYSKRYDSWMINHESGWKDLHVIAWMPLPEPYRKKGQKNDLISRQAAIDAIVNTPSEVQNKNIPLTNQYDGAAFRQIEILGILESLPSAQPATNCSEIPNGSDDTISRQAAIDCVTYDVEYTIECLKALSSAQPERKKGQWLRYGEDGYPNDEDTVFWQCDQCLEQYTGRTKRIPNFCPNCGADMRGE